MIEADIVLGYLQDKTGPIPIMAHPPNTTGDLSLEQFLDVVLKQRKSKDMRKGIKLDFKTQEAFMKSETIVEQFLLSDPVSKQVVIKNSEFNSKQCSENKLGKYQISLSNLKNKK